MNAHNDTFESYWTKKDVARFLSVSVRKIEQMMKSKKLPFLKIGGAVRFIPEEVKRFVETNFRSISLTNGNSSRMLT
jgi:excisionase family DNA binding protein